MPDFYQTGVVSTLHRLGPHDFERFEQEFAQPGWTPVKLLLPCLASDLKAPAMEGILKELESVRYLHQVILVLGSATPADYTIAVEKLSPLSVPWRVLWLESPRIDALLKTFDERGVSAGDPGKGRAVWMGFGLANADEHESAVAVHDCDIVTYKRELLDRLCYPLSSPEYGYDYSKGYYARVSGQLHGRVVRLFFTPLVRTLERLIGRHPFLEFVDSFRYPLSGEFALTTSLSRLVRIPGDWGLEIGFLAEIYRLSARERVCDVEILEHFYEHKHRPLVDANEQGGLRRMATEIARTIFRTLAIEAVPLGDGLFRSLRVAYLRLAQDYIRRFAHEARINALPYDRHLEGTAVDMFTRALGDAIDQFSRDPLEAQQLPNWGRVRSAVPTVFERIRDVVDADAREFAPARARPTVKRGPEDSHG
jgi:glucosyl-3-phosphoglycerate synthase